MAKWWNPFSWGSKDPSIMIEERKDPLKEAVASPLSSFLSSRIGQGLPRYTESTGQALAYDWDTDAQNRYKEFISLSPEDWYQKSVADPTIRDFKRDLLPVIQEGYAGSLRGSGRYGAEEAGITQLSESLAAGREAAKVNIAKEQLAAGQARADAANYVAQKQYDDWFKSLPENNPVLGQALQFLNEGTGTGTTYFSALDPGKEGWFKDLILASISASGGSKSKSSSGSGSGEGGDDKGSDMTQAAIDAAIAAAITAAIASSDVRLKDDIAFLHDTRFNLPVYKWTWKPGYEHITSESPTIGLLAQDVQEVYPEAVLERHGFLHIDYSKLEEVYNGTGC